jgi:hypothetical protein
VDLMSKEVREIYQRGLDASYNEFNPFRRVHKQFYWWQAGFYDAWGEMPKERK